MKGAMLIVPVTGPEVRVELTEPPQLEAMQKAIMGYMEIIPHFRTLKTDAGVVPCVAICNEEGKLARPEILPRNPRANALWAEAMRREHRPLGPPGIGPEPDYLVGNIVILYGDAEFMSAL